MFTSSRCFVITAGVLLALQSSWAGPPFVTDDPEPVEKGHWEFYLATQHTWARDGVAGTLPHVEMNYGPIDDVQLHLIAPMVYDKPDDARTMEYGYGDTELGVKWRPIHKDALFKGSPQVGVFPLIEIPTGDEDNGLGNGHAQYFLPVWLQKSLGAENREWTIYGGGGYWINTAPGSKNFGLVGVVLQKQITDQLTLGGELFHSTSSGDGEDPHSAFNVGGIYDFSDQWHLLFSMGRDIKGDNLLTGYLAIQLTF